MKKLLPLACALALSALSTSAVAGDFFVRGEAGQSDVKLKATGVGSDSDKDTAYSLRGGYWFNQNFAVETNYSQLYKQNLYRDSVNYLDAKLTTMGVGIVVKEHVTPEPVGFFVQLRGGFVRSKLAVDTNLGDASETSTKPYYGIGAGYDFSKTFGLSLNYDHNQDSVDDVKVTANTLSLGAEFRF
ncbi:MAG: porin family protein [Thermomonas sp.]|uniref:porin family protein n=1 Tax=Thermomonas sp. TaxID=1971895 RepID=UPI001ECCAAC3|nr:porin family protein [Thermomonas sp.]MBV2208414.1 porin family protein [Thermomonas sp.]